MTDPGRLSSFTHYGRTGIRCKRCIGLIGARTT